MTLNDTKPYEASSYFWGAPEFTWRILLENKPFHITPNVKIALRHLRRPDQERTIWLNAICTIKSIPMNAMSRWRACVICTATALRTCSGSASMTTRSPAGWRLWKI
ncbi:hypothetical protein AOQ84DRAFT_66735 [Glonium stellatum]|uniref:Heterokaryon incompatibility domain-containing protein n=1 Tax=Glonium stellatum TaxID=574774 RepID=A0A8E2FBZ8_9PEZI|nr:hypothetical protein AOQ84DRAFT_66735 [Glonium stellatum]